jgi:hypothetical protein
MTEQEQTEQEGEQPDLSALIDSVVGPLKTEAAWLYDKATILQATADSSTREEIYTFVGQCGEVAAKASAGHAQLIAGGIQDWVYSVKACHELMFWANDAAGHANSAAASEYPTEIRGMIESAVHSVFNGKSSIDGA